MLTLFFLIVLSVSCFLSILLQGIYLIHRFQQLGYINLKFINWLQGNQYRKILIWNIFELFIPLTLVLGLYFWLKPYEVTLYKTIISSIMIAVYSWKIVHPFIAGWIGKKADVKKPLVYTKRVKRLFATLTAVTVISLVSMCIFTAVPFSEFSLDTWRFFQFNSFILLFSVISPMFVLSAAIINTPLEKCIHLVYFYKAKSKLAKSSVKNIGITGSFGKTSTKFFVTSILNEKFYTLTTPSSFNTPMGLSKVINSEKLDDYKFFVAEMGADHKGDIGVLCRLVVPNYGIITAIGNQHLETFGSLENIIETKLALFYNIRPDGFGVYNLDSDILREAVKKRVFTIPLYTYTMRDEFKADADIYAEDIMHTRNGLRFNAVFKEGIRIHIETVLLGKHNVSNLLGAVLTAHRLGMTPDEIKSGIKKITPVEHRLQRIDAGTGVLVLDDAFNSNYDGAVEALNVLREIDGNKKIIVTPGFVELGDEEDRYNYLLGVEIGKKTDFAILIGTLKTQKIREGIISSGYEPGKIFTVKNLKEAQEVLAGLLKIGDVVLFENDLPDMYSENC